MSVSVLPLTRQDDAPRYSAADFRRLVLPWMTPWDGFSSPFSGVSGVRWGASNPLVQLSEGVVTVQPHMGVVRPFSLLPDTYTYFVDEVVSLTYPDNPTETLYVFVSVTDPSLSYGDTPGASVVLVTTDERSSLHGYTLASITEDGEVSEEFAWILPDGKLVVRTMEQLQEFTPGKMTTARAFLTPETTGYHYTDFIYDGENWRYASPTRIKENVNVSTSATTSFTLDGASDFMFTGWTVNENGTRPAALTHPNWDIARWAQTGIQGNDVRINTTRSGDTFTLNSSSSGIFSYSNNTKTGNVTLQNFFGLIPLTLVSDSNWYPPTY